MTASAGPVLKKLYREFGDRVAFVMLFVREAHPGDCYAQPESFEQKLQYARDYQRRDDIPWPVAVDDVEGRLHHQLDLKPNAAYLMDIHGRAVMRVLWSNDGKALRDGLEAMVAERRPSQPDRQTRLLPMLRGMGAMDETLRLAGREAQRDILHAAPPMYALARLAGLFRPLPPLARGAAASGLAALDVGLAIGLGWKIARNNLR